MADRYADRCGKCRPFCENAQLCTNDGGEFELVNGNFQDAKRRRTIKRDEFKASVADGVARSPFRKFKGDDGKERLSLGNVDMVGRKVTDGNPEHGEVTIVEEILD
jgi:hypothetical protein